MATGDTKVNLYDKKLVGPTELKDWFLDYLCNEITRAETIRHPVAGVFEFVDIDITTADEVSLDPNDFDAADSLGHTITANTDLVEHLPFENSSGIWYEIGLTYGYKPDGAETNPRTGQAEYRGFTDLIGMIGPPGYMEYTGGVIKFQLTAHMGTDDGTGRIATVWLNDPVSGVSSIAIEECTVYHSGGANWIDLEGLLGQDPDEVSEDGADYTVIVHGPIIIAGGVLYGQPEIVYIGKVQGGGSGNPPTAKDTTGQYIYYNPAIVLEDLTETNPDNHLKIRVKAYATEATGWRQISVYDVNDDAYPLYITKAGDVYIGHTGMTNSPTIYFMNSGSIAKIESYNDGSIGIVPDTGAELQIGTTGDVYLLGSKITAEDTLQLNDTNTGTYVDFSDTDATAIHVNLPQNVLGAINVLVEHNTLWQETVGWNYGGASLISGCECSLGGGTTINVNSGVVSQTGRTKNTALFYPTVTTDAYLYYKYNTDTVIQSASYPGPTPATDIPLAFVKTSGGTPQEVVDIRRPIMDLRGRTEIFVGKTSDVGTKLPEAHFETVYEAVECIKAIDSGSDRTWRIRVIGVTTESSTPIVLPDGVVIEGDMEFGIVTWNSNGPLFQISGSTNGVTIRSLHVQSSNTGSLPTSPPYRCPLYCTGTCNNVYIDQLFTKGSEDLSGLIECTGTLRGCVIKGLQSTESELKDFGIHAVTLTSTMIKDCVMWLDTATGTEYNLTGINCSSAANNSTIDSCHISGPDGQGIYLASGLANSISNTSIVGTGTYGIQLRSSRSSITNCTVDGCPNSGLYIPSSAELNVISGCVIRNCGETATNGESVTINGDNNTITGCYVSSDHATTPVSIRINSTANETTIVGNRLQNLTGISDAGTNTFYSTSAGLGYGLNNIGI